MLQHSKHVPLMELNPREAVKTIFLRPRNVAEAASHARVKAVRNGINR